MPLRQLKVVIEELEQKAAGMLRAMPEAEPGFLDSMVLRGPGASERDLEAIERVLGRKLPASVRDMLSMYEISGLELAGVIFGGEGTFCDFLRRQLQSPESLWGAWRQDEDLLIIAASSGYVLFASVTDGRIWSCRRDSSLDQRFIISADLEKLIRALGTLVVAESVMDEDALSSELAMGTEAAGSEPFWLDRIRGYD
jgi:hypothetical protein